MKRLAALFVSLVAVLALALSASHFVWGKAHVPVKKAQVCHKGETITVSAEALNGHMGHGDCRLPACDFANIFFTGDSCDSNNPGGNCGLPNARSEACGVTAACPAGPDCF